ncbi:MAG: hypothetical protein JNM36_07470 [Chitinophagales bacterium]|jgi:hypothetical protein|nr:hypothetical protein [Chitinophagales bacterium]
MDFNKKFKTYSNTELLRIINNPDDYQSNAVEVAKTILSDRQLTGEEIKFAKDELEVERQEKSNEEQQKRNIENKFKNIGISIFNIINPIQSEMPTAEKMIKTISLVYGGIFLFHFFYKEFEIMRFMFSHLSPRWDISVVLYFLSLFITPTVIILFYKKNKYGWLLFTIFLTFSAISTLNLFISTMNMNSTEISVLSNIFPTPPLAILLPRFLFFAGTIWVISREEIRNAYTISKEAMILTILITVVVVGLIPKMFF